jgi:hypothetical protein
MQQEEIKVYLSLPITGHDEKERRQTAARKSAELMYQHEDWRVINPFHIYDHMKAELLAAGQFDEPSYEDILQADLAELSTCQLAYFMQGWQTSRGCRREMSLCREKNITTLFQ